MKIVRSGFFVSAILFTLLLISFYSRSVAQVRKVKPEIIKTDELLIVFEKKPCLGYCQTYKADLYSNGQVKITGMQNVTLSSLEEYKFKLSEEEVFALFNKAEKAGFFAYPDRLENLITDHAAKELTLYKKGNPKKVVFEEKPPLQIADLISSMEGIIEG